MRKCNADPKGLYCQSLSGTINLKNLAFLPLLLLGACQTTGANIFVPSAKSIAQSYLTTSDQQNLLAKQADKSASQTAPNEAIIRINPDKNFQSFIGVGAAITDASAILIGETLDEKSRNDLMNELFGKSGLNLSFTRLTIGASDFSATHYSLNDMPKGETDPELKNFNLNAMPKSVIPVTKLAKAINPNLSIMATPWSPPGWMKTSDSMIKGSLKPEYYQANADYMARFSSEMAKNDVKIDFLSIQNEPQFAGSDYPGMVWQAKDRAKFIKENLGPTLQKLPNAPKILEWDHNWDQLNQPLEVLSDKDASKFINGVAWHCYGGDVNSQSQVYEKYPDKDVYFTECSGGEWGKNWDDSMPWQSKNLVIGTTRNWARGVLLWNLALDENYGPHLGGCGDCRGVVTINSKTKQITRNMEYYVLGHISKFVQIGAQRIETNSGQNDIDNVAFQNPDGSIAIILANSSKSVQSFSAELNNKYYHFELPKSALLTIIIPK